MLTMGRRRFMSQQQTAAPAWQPSFRQEERTGAAGEGPRFGFITAAVEARRSQEVGPLSGRCPKACPRQGTRGRRGNHWRPLCLIGVVLVSGCHRWRQSVAQGVALVWRYEARPVPMKKAQCL